MKEFLKNIDKTTTVLTIIYRVAIYGCWYLFAIAFSYFLTDSITDKKMVGLVFCLILIYVVRNGLKYLYKNVVNKTYHDIKHSIEMSYFKKLDSLDIEEVDKVDREYLSNKILDVSYNYTKMIHDIGEYLIPALIGTCVMVVKVCDINSLLGVLSFIALIGIVCLGYFEQNDEEVSTKNYNDLLKDFIMKMPTIKRLNIFDYCYKKLEKNEDNDMCLLKRGETNQDMRFTNLLYAIITVVFILSFFLVKNTVTRLGILLFLIIIMSKLQNLLYEVSPSIKNFINGKLNKSILDSYFKENEEKKYTNSWKVINVKDGKVNYEEVSIKIPNFEVSRKDHIGILGKSGQGKSTILNVLSGVFKMSEGTILLDNNESKKQLDVVYTTKETSIFKVSLRDNLTFGKKVNDDVLLDLINEINLSSWYGTLENGLDTIIDYDLELGIVQRINLLRGIIMDKDLYFMDEPTAEVDVESEKIMATMIKKYYEDKTFIIVSHRPVITNICKKHYFIKEHTLLEKEPLL